MRGVARDLSIKRDKRSARHEWLRLLYLDHGLTVWQLARLFLVEPKTVARWLREARIRKRPLG